MLTFGVVLLYDNARPHETARTRTLLEHLNWELFDHLPHSPVFAPSDYHPFTYLKNSLRSQRFKRNEELMEVVKTWPSSQKADFFDIGLQNLIPRYDMYLKSESDYVEKKLKYVHIFLQ
jgi:hypothetical protein